MKRKTGKDTATTISSDWENVREVRFSLGHHRPTSSATTAKGQFSKKKRERQHAYSEGDTAFADKNRNGKQYTHTHTDIHREKEVNLSAKVFQHGTTTKLCNLGGNCI